MIRQWWLTIQERYPLALEECLAHFREKHPGSWRDAIQKVNELQQYFQTAGIEVLTKKGWAPGGYRYGSIVKSDRLKLERPMLFYCRENALSDALHFAFMVRQEALENRIRKDWKPKGGRRGKPI